MSSVEEFYYVHGREKDYPPYDLIKTFGGLFVAWWVHVNAVFWSKLYREAVELGQKHLTENPYCITSVGTLADYDRIIRIKHYRQYPFWKAWKAWRGYKFN